MFTQDTHTSVQLSGGSPSLILNNLSSSSSDCLCFVRSNDVFVVQISGESVKLPLAKSKIFQAAFVNICGTPVIAVLSSLGLQIWSSTADTMIFHYPLAALFDSDGNDDEKFIRGVATVSDYLCVGLSNGGVLVFNGCNQSEGCDFPLTHNISTDHGVPISAMAATNKQDSGEGNSAAILAVGNDNGKIVGFRAQEAFMEAFSFEGYGHPVTALAVHETVLITAYSTGHIRLFRTDIIELCVEITAHTRIVSGLTVHQNLFISCAHDQYVHIWTLPDFRSRGSCDVTKLHTELLENRICTGVAALSKDRFAVACYDDEEIAVFRRD